MMFFLGLLFAILVLAVVGISGALTSSKLQLKDADKELRETQITLGRFVRLEQEREKIKQSVVVNLTEDQITALATRITSRMQTIHQSEQSDSLLKMN